MAKDKREEVVSVPIHHKNTMQLLFASYSSEVIMKQYTHDHNNSYEIAKLSIISLHSRPGLPAIHHLFVSEDTDYF